MLDITSAAIATIISATTSAAVALIIARGNARKYLDDQLDMLLKLAVQYPYLESDSFAKSWTSTYDPNDEKHLRYEHYCTLLFNYLSRVAEYYKYKRSDIEKYVALKSWVRCHAAYWRDPTDAYGTVDEYDKRFVALIENYLGGK